MEKEVKVLIVMVTVGLVCGIAGLTLMSMEPAKAADVEMVAQTYSINGQGQIILHGEFRNLKGDDTHTVQVDYEIFDDATSKSYHGTYFVQNIPRFDSKSEDHNTYVKVSDASQVRVTYQWRSL